MSKTKVVLDKMVRKWVSSPPAIYKQLQETLNDPDLPLEKIDVLLNSDHNLTARLLKFVNSSFYTLDTKVKTLADAFSVIGVKPLIEIALSMVMVQKFKDLVSGTLDIESFWKHNIACGLASRVIAQNLGRDDSETFYTGGMLHDIGFLVISKENAKKAQEIIIRCKFEELPQSQVEEEEFGFTHAQVGAQVFKEWKQPPSLIEAVRYHHNPTQAENFPLEAAVLHVADYLVDNMKYTVGENYATLALDANVLSMTGVTKDSMVNIHRIVHEQLNETLEIFTH